MKRMRLDQLVVARGLAESRERAQRLILAGEVYVDGQRAAKAGHAVPESVAIELAARPRYVSRGGEKLEGAFAAFPLNVAGLDCIDVGASTGGFTDCLLQHGAVRVIALDVGHGQIHPCMANHTQVHVIEHYNARNLHLDDLPFRPRFATVDVSFISLRLILPPLAAVLPDGGEMVTLIKPQFEAGRHQAPRGVVRDPAVHTAVVEAIRTFGTHDAGLAWLGVAPSPLRGPEGNVEFLAWWRKGEASV
jgi:23S rRNA (cytidine1920-2'-O)/16S rRNA (cytidine1409-2'-O)-methyltransferase